MKKGVALCTSEGENLKGQQWFERQAKNIYSLVLSKPSYEVLDMYYRPIFLSDLDGKDQKELEYTR